MIELGEPKILSVVMPEAEYEPSLFSDLDIYSQKQFLFGVSLSFI